jgi:hypothetical protein
MSLHAKISKLGKNLKHVIGSIIDPTELRKLARETGFIKRSSSRLSGEEYIQALVLESVDGERSTLGAIADTMRNIKSTAAMTIQAVQKRINSKKSLAFIKRVFESALHSGMNRLHTLIGSSESEQNLLKPFSNVYLQDSSESLLNAALKEDFKGSGGGSGNGIGEASVKIDAIYEYKRKFFSVFKITDRREPDVVLGEAILEIIKKGDLVLRDLGYSSINVFIRIQELGAFFISRLHANLNVYKTALDKDYLTLGTFLQKKANKRGIVDTFVYLSAQMFRCRMIAYRVPSELERERRDDYLKECKKRKRKPNKEYIKRLAFTIFITNIPMEMLKAEYIGTVYRVRWQIELIFKTWKSDLNFDHFRGKDPIRIRCLIYSRLIAILILFIIFSTVDQLALEVLEKEISLQKVINWLKRNARFFVIVMQGLTDDLWRSLVSACEDLLCKDQRNRETTRELLEFKRVSYV